MSEFAFDRQIRAMSFRQIVEAMVRGLRKQHVKISMITFGCADSAGVCYGCAATNTICEIIGKPFTSETIEHAKRALFVETTYYTLDTFESAIDMLRVSRLDPVNQEGVKRLLRRIGCDTPPEGYHYGPVLHSSFQPEDLDAWEQSVAHLPLERVL